jgi:hypothetical protein
MREVLCKQYDWDYWCAHKGHPGASDADKVATPAKGDYPASAQTLINQQIFNRLNPTYGMFEDTASKAMRNGLEREPEARRFAEFEMDKEIREVGLVFDDLDQYCCSPDGLLVGDDAGIELKVPNGDTHIGYLRAGELPQCYRPQCHWSMVVTGFDRWWFMSWSPIAAPLLIEVRRDEYTAKVAENMKRWWGEYMEAWSKIEATLPPPPPPKILTAAGFEPVELRAYEAPY